MWRIPCTLPGRVPSSFLLTKSIWNVGDVYISDLGEDGITILKPTCHDFLFESSIKFNTDNWSNRAGKCKVPCRTMQDSAGQCRTMQDSAGQCRTVHSISAVQCNTVYLYFFRFIFFQPDIVACMEYAYHILIIKSSVADQFSASHTMTDGQILMIFSAWTALRKTYRLIPLLTPFSSH